MVSNVRSLRNAAAITSDPTSRGWLSLGALAASTGQQGIGWTNGVVRWQESHFGHPGLSIVESLDLPDRKLQAFPQQVALLLPLSGKNGTAGNAVQNGFFGAYYSAATGLGNAQTIRIYDVVASGGASEAYRKAVNDGADFVVGPLLRASVNKLAAEPLLPVPVLALNNISGDNFAPPLSGRSVQTGPSTGRTQIGPDPQRRRQAQCVRFRNTHFGRKNSTCRLQLQR